MEDDACEAANGGYREFDKDVGKCFNKTDSYKNRIFPEMICGEPKRVRSSIPTGICLGDSGGPYTVEKDEQHYLVGVSSWTFGCPEVILKILTQP